jgi:glyoxylase-like metal-dependent hydrolase (beta-lactamase superfamily II)
VAAWLALSSAALPIAAQAPQAPRPRVDDGGVQLLPVRGSIYMLAGAGSNVTLQIGQDGVLVVDTGSGLKTAEIVAAITRLTDKPIRWIVNTHYHADHTGGNGPIAKTGRSVPQVAIGAGRLFTDADDIARIVAHENVLKRMSAPTGARAPVASEHWPSATFFVEEEELFFNGEPIQIMHQRSAHTDGDVLVFFRRSDVVAAGDLFVTDSYPVIDVAAGGTFPGYLDALNELIHITIPEEKQEGGTWVVPGHGRLSDEADVVDVRDMATIVRDRLQVMIKAGMTLEQVKAAKPTRDYDDRYRSNRAWTSDMFVEAVYRTLSGSSTRAGS